MVWSSVLKLRRALSCGKGGCAICGLNCSKSYFEVRDEDVGLFCAFSGVLLKSGCRVCKAHMDTVRGLYVPTKHLSRVPKPIKPVAMTKSPACRTRSASKTGIGRPPIQPKPIQITKQDEVLIARALIESIKANACSSDMIARINKPRPEKALSADPHSPPSQILTHPMVFLGVPTLDQLKDITATCKILPAKHAHVSAVNKLVITLLYLRSGWIQDHIAIMFDLNQQTVSDIINDCRDKLELHFVPKWLRAPTTQEMKARLSPEFASDGKYAEIAGVVDGTFFSSHSSYVPNMRAAQQSQYKKKRGREGNGILGPQWMDY